MSRLVIRFLIRLCVLVLFSASASGWAAQIAGAANAPSLYDQGRAAFAGARWDEAAALMAKSRAQEPVGSDALLYEGRALANARRFAEADAALRNYSQQHPESADALYLLAFVEQRENKPADSLATYTAAAKLRTPDSEQLTEVALDYVLLHDYPDAIRWLERAVALNPKNADAWYSLGRADYTQSRFTEAENAFRKSLELEPNSIKAAENLGLTLDAENRPGDAEAFFKQAVSQASAEPGSDEWPYLDYANFLLDADRAAEAVPLLSRATAIASACVACHEKLGRALAATGDVQRGIAELEKAVSLSPKEAHLHYELGLAYKQAGQAEKAKVELATSARLYGSRAAGERK